MATRTIEDIHVVLPVAEGGYYRFGGLPRLIADALYPECPDADEEAQELQWMRHAIYGVEKVKKDLMRAAHVAEGEPGYLHVAENSASKRPLEWRMGAVLESGLVHLDWLNEWGESRRPPLVFSTVATQEPQDAPPAPVVAESADDCEAWKVKARETADAIIKRQRAKDLHPSQEDIADEIAREFRKASIVGVGGKPLTGAYIKRHALNGISSAAGKRLSTSIRRGK